MFCVGSHWSRRRGQVLWNRSQHGLCPATGYLAWVQRRASLRSLATLFASCVSKTRSQATKLGDSPMLRRAEIGFAMLLVPLVGTLVSHRSTQPPGTKVLSAEVLRPTGELPRVEVAAPGPRLWLATSGDAKVYVFGFGEAKDTSWLTPSIRRAFEQSSELWLETAGPSEPTNQSPAERRAAAERMKRLGYEPGRTLFECVGAVGPGTNARVHRGTRNQSGLDSTNASLEGILLNRPGILVQTTGDPQPSRRGCCARLDGAGCRQTCRL